MNHLIDGSTAREQRPAPESPLHRAEERVRVLQILQRRRFCNSGREVYQSFIGKATDESLIGPVYSRDNTQARDTYLVIGMVVCMCVYECTLSGWQKKVKPLVSFRVLIFIYRFPSVELKSQVLLTQLPLRRIFYFPLHRRT